MDEKVIEWNKKITVANGNSLNFNLLISDFQALVDAKRKKFLEESTKKMEEEVYKCDICSKMFHGSNFVHTHILNKHDAIIKETVDQPVSKHNIFKNHCLI